MSDLADIGSSQLGYANLAASQAGGPSITSQANTAANTALVGSRRKAKRLKTRTRACSTSSSLTPWDTSTTSTDKTVRHSARAPTTPPA